MARSTTPPNPGETILDNTFNITLRADDLTSDPIDACTSHLRNLASGFRDLGLSAAEQSKETVSVINKIEASLKRLTTTSGDPRFAKAFKDLRDFFTEEKGRHNEVINKAQPFKWIGDTKPLKDFQSVLVTAGSAFLSFKGIFKPFREGTQFIMQIAEANRQLYMMSETSLMAADKLASIGGVLKGFGGGANDIASFSESFEMEMEKRRRGMGTGGKYTEALMRFGIVFDPNSGEKTMENIVKFMSDPTKTESEKRLAAKVLGISDAMYVVAKKGLEYWNEQKAITAERTKYSEEAAEKAASLKAATAQLSLQFENLKNRVFVTFAPVLETVTGWATKILDKLDEWGMTGPALLIGVILKLGWSFVSSFGSTLLLIGAMKKLRNTLIEVAEAAAINYFTHGGSGVLPGGAGNGAASGAAKGAAKSAGKAAAGAAGAAGALGKVGRGLGGVAKGAGKLLGKVALPLQLAFSTFNLISARHEVDKLLKEGKQKEASATKGRVIGDTAGMLAGMAAGAAIGSIIPGIGTAIGGAIGGLAGSYFGSRIGEDIATSSSSSGMPSQPIPPSYASVPQMPTYGNYGHQEGNSVKIDRIDLVVNSNSSNPMDVAEEVRKVLVDEFQVIADNTQMVA